MSGKVFDLTPEAEGPRRSARRAAWAYEGAGGPSLSRSQALERSALDALRGADYVVSRRAARGQEGGEDAVTLALARPGRAFDREEWERTVRRVAADRAAGAAYLARKREERLARQAAAVAEGGVSLPAASMGEAGVVQAQAEVGREGGALSPALSGRIQARRGGGQPLEATVRRGLEGVFGVDFSPVRIHADPEADTLNRGVAAVAFTVGSDIFFRAGAYQPHTLAGQHLLAHELTHVVQQRMGSLGMSGATAGGGTMTVGAADDRHEVEAEATAHRVTTTLQRQEQTLLAPATTPGAGIARQHDPALALVPSATGVLRVPDDTVRRSGLGDLWDTITHAGHAIVDEVKRRVSETVRKLPGYTLLTILLGQDPFTGQRVARTPTSLAHAVLELAPGGLDLFQKLEQHHVLSKAFDWFNAHLVTLSRVVMTLPHRLEEVLTSLSVNVVDDVNRVTNVFTGVLDQLVSFARGAVGEVAGVAVQAIMAAFGPMGERVYEALKNAGAAMMQILRDPGTFLHNLGEAVKQGGTGFVQHIGAHLKEGLISLLTNGLFGAGVTLPAHLSLDAPGVITLALDLLNLGWDHLVSLLRSRLGPHGNRVVALVQAGSQELGPVASLAQDLRKGPLAFAHHLVEGVGDLTGLLLEQVGDWLKTQMLPRMIIKLISMVVPGAGVASALMSIYEGISFLISHIDEIAALVNRVIAALGRIMAGDIGPAAQSIEDAMARTLPLVLKFLFRLLGVNIDTIGGRVKAFLESIRRRIDAALTRLIDFIVGHIPSRLLGGASGAPGRQGGRAGTTTPHAPRPEELPQQRFEAGGEQHKLWINAQGSHHNAPVIMMSSTPTPVTQFLNDAHNSADIPAAHKTVIPRGRSLVTEMTRLATEVVRLEGEGKDAKAQYHELAGKENELCGIIQGILRRVDIAVFDRRYKIEGIVGRYDQMPAQTQDMMTGDHQPQAEMLVEVSRLPAFAGREIQHVVGSDAAHVPGGIAINLHENRHKAGRTYGGKSRRTLAVGRARLASEVHNAGHDQEAQRTTAIRVLREELHKDVDAMRAVVNRPNNDPVWDDIHHLPLTQADKDTLINWVRHQVLEGETRIKNQNLERLKNPG